MLVSFEKKLQENGDNKSEKININVLRYIWDASPLNLKENYYSFFRRVPYLKNFSDREIRIFINHLHKRKFEDAEAVFRAGDSGYGLYFIFNGAISIQEPSGKEITQFSKGSYFGELALLDEGHQRPACAIAKGQTILLGFFKPDLENLMARHPLLAAKIVHEIAKLLANKMGNLIQDITELKRQIEGMEN